MVGIDPDLERLEVARKKYQCSNIEYLEGRGENIPGGNYDVVFSNYVLHWCKDQDQVIKQVYRSLKRGGKFGFVADIYFDIVPTAFTSDMVSSEFEMAAKDNMHPISMSKYKQLLSSNDFDILHIEECKREWKFKDVHSYVQMLRMHTKGDFDMTHFNVDVMKEHYGEGEINIAVPFCIVVAQT